MKARRQLVLGTLAAAVVPAKALSAPAAKGRHRIAFLLPWSEAHERQAGQDEPASSTARQFVPGIVAALERFGHVDGSDIEVVRIYIRDREELFARLSDVDAIVVPGAAGALEVHRRLPNAPILVWALGDPVEEGVAKSFVRPGLNITGLVQPLREAASKQVEILRRFVPDLSGIAIFQGAKRDADDERFYRFVEAIARDAGMNVTFATPSSWDEVHSAFHSLRSRGFQAAIWATNPPGSTKGIVRLAREAIDARIALVDYFDHLADRGFLACYGEQDQDLYLRFAQQLDRILRAGSASDIPFMNPSRYHLRVNLRTAAELRLAVPAEIRVMADRLVS